MINTRTASVVVTLIYLGALAVQDVHGKEDIKAFINVKLVATRANAGQVGTAVLVPAGDKTRVKLQISGVPNQVSRPIHLNAYFFEGTCENRNAETRYRLTGSVLSASVIHPEAMGAFVGPLSIAGNLPRSLESVRATQFGISIQLTPVDGNAEIFCGSFPN